MKIISKSLLLNKNILRYFFMFSLLLIIFIFLLNIRHSLNKSIYNSNESLTERTIWIDSKDNITKEELEKSNKIEEIIEEDGFYKIVFDSKKDLNNFKETYKNDYNQLITFNNDNSKDLKEKVLVFFNILIYVFIFLLFSILIFNILEIITESKKNISLYKLLGFKNKDILKKYIFVLIILYTIIYILAILINIFIAWILNIIINIFTENFQIIINNNLITLYISIILTLIIMTLISYLKIKKISPISFMNK